MSNQSPFELTVNTVNAAEGWQKLQVDGYDSQGRLARDSSVGVVIANGSRTLTPRERRARETTGELLARYLYLQPYPGLWEHLCGAIAAAQGEYRQAVDNFEAAFAQAPQLPRLRDDLLAAYQHLGIATNGSPTEVHRLMAPGAQIALTFDDGPHPKVTPWILDHLDRVGAKATFFVVGKQVDLYPELAREILQRGHQIGSHSYTHRNMRELSAWAVERELVRSRAAIRRATGVNATLFRPPGGHYDETVRQATGLWGYTTVFWTANVGNYPGAPAHRARAGLLRDAVPGGIVLLHNGEDATVDILPGLLNDLQQRGLRMVSLPVTHPHALTVVGEGSGR
jgi:peptidoglycan/xylan/chitin deacetylase (PgdA/CDA1 family)